MLVNSIDTAIQAMQIEIDKLKDRANDVNPKVEKLDDLVRVDDPVKISTIQIPNFLTRNGDILPEYKDYDTVSEVTKSIDQKFSELIKLYTDRHEQNIPKIENNKKLFENVKKYMSLIGIPEEGYYDVTTRGRTKNIKRQNGYIQDMYKYVKFDDEYSRLMDRIRSYKNTLSINFRNYSMVYHSNKEKLARQEADEKLNQYITYLSIKYNVDNTYRSVYDVLLSMYPYAGSANPDDPAMQEVCNDYNELMSRLQHRNDLLDDD